MILPFAIACTPDPAAADPHDTTVAFQPTPLEASYAPEDVDAAVASVLAADLFLPIDLYAWFDTLFSDVASAGTSCPARETSADDPLLWTSYWSGTCTGTTYTVSGDWQITERREVRGSELHLSVLELHSFVGETLPDHDVVRGGGNANIQWIASHDTATFALTFGGSYSDPSASGAIVDGVTAVLSMAGTWWAARGYSGTLSGPLGGEDASLDFRDLVFTSGCASPVGTLALRDPSSGWWTVDLTDDCSGCGALAFDGTDAGTACPGVVITDALEARIVTYVETPP